MSNRVIFPTHKRKAALRKLAKTKKRPSGLMTNPKRERNV